MQVTRRSLLRTLAAGSAALAAGTVPMRPEPAYSRPLGPVIAPVSGETVRLDLIAAERQLSLPCFAGRRLPLWTFTDAALPPVVRLRLGDRLVARVENRLPRAGEHISIHWHGIRLPNDQDGVAWLTQDPIEPGEAFDYAFTPPDTGTFFFHTHCNTVEQLGRGLAGILIVEGDETEPYDAEEVLVLRDWRVGDAGFLPFMTDEGASRAGSFGPIRSANGAPAASFRLPASADVRIRVLNVDASRLLSLGVEGAEAAVVAIDGIAVPPFPLKAWTMGPAMRADIVLRTPPEGGTARLVDYRPAKPFLLAAISTAGPPRRTGAFDPAPLRAARIAEPDLGRAERLPLTLSTTATADAVSAALEGPAGGIDDLCLSDRTFWALNKAAWPADGHRRLPPPLMVLRKGGSYVIEIANTTRQIHPMHLHGLTFKVLRSNKRDLPVHHADTVLLLPKERLEVAFVADNPGDWMIHCHLIEHQETGMMGYLRVA
ncbi:multicopper oxidase family protein [Chthonobacter albigriseus]|uniref:multicopper oxidase family protein n=1 Tax=Chthonobacter albigriseus TaxID=1683161 RepID=UPI0015EF5D4C|nr:multicopper oxidase family protein [Chthonobacter albigriseus]